MHANARRRRIYNTPLGQIHRLGQNQSPKAMDFFKAVSCPLFSNGSQRWAEVDRELALALAMRPFPGNDPET
jgi:hypothetical protein